MLQVQERLTTLVFRRLACMVHCLGGVLDGGTQMKALYYPSRNINSG
jgi:hypothetical protein